MLKTTLIILLCLIIILQISLWTGKGNIKKLLNLAKQVEIKQANIAVMQQRNVALATEVEHYKKSPDSIEEMARYELGMIDKDESFYRVLEPIE